MKLSPHLLWQLLYGRLWWNEGIQNDICYGELNVMMTDCGSWSID